MQILCFTIPYIFDEDVLFVSQPGIITTAAVVAVASNHGDTTVARWLKKLHDEAQIVHTKVITYLNRFAKDYHRL